MDRSDSRFEGSLLENFGDPIKRSTRLPAYLPEALDPALLPLANRLSCRRQPVSVTMGGGVIGFRPAGLGAIDAIAPAGARVVFHLRIGERPLALVMAKDLYELILARIDPDLLAADLDAGIWPLLLESCIEDSLTQAETRLQARIELAAVTSRLPERLDGPDIALDIEIDGEPAGQATLRAGLDDAQRLADLFERQPKQQRSFGELDVELRFRARACRLDLGEIQALDVGDVLLIEEDASTWGSLAATVGEQGLFPIEVTAEGPTLKAPFRQADPSDREEWMMVDTHYDDEAALEQVMRGRSEPDSAGQADPVAPDGTARPEPAPTSEASDAALDDLPIKVVFELGRHEMPLGDLQSVGPGHVFALNRPLGEAVDIAAGGKRIGRGEIVRIDDQIGVRILSLFGQNGA